ncbi:MAG: hypothetical protein NTX53_18945 [candidate division WOR-3 bacterium]|nr:hypothetical protein [candidate division WOR-3 bacterium]
MTAPFQIDFRPLRYFRYRNCGRALVRFRAAYVEFQAKETDDLRSRVNESIPSASEAIDRLGLMMTSVDPLTRVILRGVNVVREALNTEGLDSIGVWPRRVLDVTEQGIAECHEKARAALWLLLNPLVWLWSCVEQLLRAPFMLVAAAGVRTVAFEMSALGQLLKLIEMLLAILVALRKLQWI